MAFYIIDHKVKDFDVWKKAYDAFEATRSEYGVKEHYALQSVNDSSHVLVVGEGELGAIEKFINSAELKSAMAGAGITGAPNIFIGEDRK